MVTCFCCVTASGGTALGNPFGSVLAPTSQQNQPVINATLNFFGQQSTANTQQASSGGEQLFCCVCVCACVRACVCACVHVCMCACVHASSSIHSSGTMCPPWVGFANGQYYNGGSHCV